jgi:diguanylate cyclase (GGDEF)-like protein
MTLGRGLTLAAAIRRLFARSSDPYAGADIVMARRFARIVWPLCTLLTFVLITFFPPTRAVGSAGWLFAGPAAAIAIAGIAFAYRKPEGVTYDFLWAGGWVVLVDLALLQWLAGGRVSPYHEVYLFLTIGTALMHPPRRFVLFIAAMVAAAFAPAAYAPATARIGEIATEQSLWVGLGIFLLVFMRGIRAQRVALKQAGDEGYRLARVDPLTGLGNRRAFDEALDRQLESARTDGGRVRLLVTDLNGFKRINDVHGHVAGDDCLRQAAAALLASVRDGDGCYRWGGDEFAVLIGAGSDGEPAALAARIEATVAALCQGPDGEPLTLACGHAELDGHATAAEAVAAADAVLLALKRRGTPVAAARG